MNILNTPVYSTDLQFPNRKAGKVRDMYDIPANLLKHLTTHAILIIATDRLSAYDVVLPTPFAGKGQLLTDISCRWFQWVEEQNTFPNHHLISTDTNMLNLSEPQKQLLNGRIMICQKTKVIPIECVARGYIAGSGWKEYQQNHIICGNKLPAGLLQCQKLPEPIFTPATKAETGHDENITYQQASNIVGSDIIQKLKDYTLNLYTSAAQYAASRGIIIADTKFEFGFKLDDDGCATDEILLIDEVLTPDSSRFWPVAEYEPGRDQNSFDKQFVRNYLEDLVKLNKWNKTPPGPEIPDHIVTKTIEKYKDARDRLWA